jgi:hypothetical protein
MNKHIWAVMSLAAGLGIAGMALTGCKAKNATSPAPVTVTVVQQPTPSCGQQVGYANVMTTGNLSSVGYIEAYPVTLAVAVKTLDMAFYLGATGSGNIGLSVYSDNSGVPGTMQDAGVITSPVLNSWNVAQLTGVNLAAGKYWLACEHQNTVSATLGSTQNTPDFEVAQSYGVPPLTMPAGTVYTTFPPYALLLDTVCQ